jgi:hypothetical protein
VGDKPPSDNEQEGDDGQKDRNESGKSDYISVSAQEDDLSRDTDVSGSDESDASDDLSVSAEYALLPSLAYDFRKPGGESEIDNYEESDDLSVSAEDDLLPSEASDQAKESEDLSVSAQDNLNMADDLSASDSSTGSEYSESADDDLDFLHVTLADTHLRICNPI